MNESYSQDHRLLERMRTGETMLYDAFMRRHHRRLHCVALRILQNYSDAEDAVQDAHLRVLTHPEQFNGQSSFLTYFTRIVANEALGRIRARGYLPTVDLAAAPGRDCETFFVSSAPNPEQWASERELCGLLGSAMQSLPPIYRTVLLIRELDELSVAESAARLGITCTCLKTRLHRAKLLLRQELGRNTRPRRRPAGRTGRKQG